ncbi:GNAT family N-acetyltransferase [Photobacterium minamisatsumaniensis]
MEVVRVTQKELSAVVPLFDQYRVFYGQPSDLGLAHAFLEARISNDESVVLLAKNEQGIGIGFTQLYPSFSSVSVSTTLILNDLYVIEEVRGQGIGKQLLNSAKAYAVDVKAKGIGLETARDNLGAQKLYESLGYVKDTEYYSYFLNLQA